MPPIRRYRRHQKKPLSAVWTTTILDLNEHCLLDIFRYLSPLEMCSVFDTCKRFRELADIHMEKFYRFNELILNDRQRDGYKMMCRFGAAVTKLSVEFLNSDHQQSKAVVSRLRKMNPELESLTLVDTNFSASLMMSPLLDNLRQLRIEYVNNDLISCDIHYSSDIRSEDKIKELLKTCKNVEELSFGAQWSSMGNRYQGIFLQQKFKRIRSLEVYEVRDFDFNNLKLFLKINPTVQSISLKRCISVDRLAAFNMPQCAPNIEALALKFGENDHAMYKYTFNLPLTNMLSQLEKLKCLALDTCYTDVTNFIASMAKRNSLTYLSLTNVMFKVNEGLDEALSNMTILKVLRLQIIFHADGQGFYKRLCRNLVNLEELHLSNSHTTCEQTRDIVENSINLKKVYIYESLLYGDEFMFSEDLYGDFVEIQSRKNVPFPITFFFVNEKFCAEMFSLQNCTLNRDVINVAKFDLSDFDCYSIPRSALL